METNRRRALGKGLEELFGEEVLDFDTLEDNQVTIRDRDTMEQIRLPIDEVEDWIKQKIEF